MVKVGVAGYGTIGQRLADGVAKQKDMELVGVADLAPTLAIRASIVSFFSGSFTNPYVSFLLSIFANCFRI